MLENTYNMISDLLNSTDPLDFTSGLSGLLTILTLTGMLGHFFVKIFSYFFHAFQYKKPISNLNNALVGWTIASETEVKYQIQNYVLPEFSDRKQNINKLLRQIKRETKNGIAHLLFAIIGRPACGKTTTMRYLYCRLSKHRKCVYFQMQNINTLENLSAYLHSQKIQNGLDDGSSVVAFFDGLDEANAFFQSYMTDSIENTFINIFFRGQLSKIHDVFRGQKLHLNCIVISLRPDFLEHSLQSLKSRQYNNMYLQVYEMVPLSDKKVIKIFKSLKTLKKMDAKLEERQQRHQHRYPPFGQERSFIRLLKEILKDNPDCIFRYPMYIRYAYAFMQDYREQKNVKDWLDLKKNMTVCFDILTNAIIKWEFHVFYQLDYSSENEKENLLKQFKQNIEQCAETIAVNLATDTMHSITKDKFGQIVQQFFSDYIYLALSHCLMVSDDSGEKFYFCHDTFYSYYLAKYLFKSDDYHLRKEQLLSNKRPSSLREMYYSILCREDALNESISKSIMCYPNRLFSLNEYLSLESETEVPVTEEPPLTLVEIQQYLPIIPKFQYRGRGYDQKEIELMMFGELDLMETGWSSLNYAQWLAPISKISDLSISGLPLTDVGALAGYNSLKRLSMRFPDERAQILDTILDILCSLNLDTIYVYSQDGTLCNKIYDCFSKKKINLKTVFVESPDFSQAYLIMYDLNQKNDDSIRNIYFYPSVRSNKRKAKERLCSGSYKDDDALLKAVFALEANESGILGLYQAAPEATYWNGLSLAACYNDSNSYNLSYDVCCKLEPYIPQDASELSVRFGSIYGITLHNNSKYKLSKQWLYNSCKYGSRWYTQERLIDLGLDLYRSWLRSGEEGLETLVNDLESSIEKLPNFQGDWRYVRFLKMRCANILHIWEIGASLTENSKVFQDFRMYAACIAKTGNYYEYLVSSIYFDLVCTNRIGNAKQGACLLAELALGLKKIMEMSDKSDYYKHGLWIMFHEQKLYHYFLLDKAKIVLKLVDRITNYPYRKEDIPLSICDTIRQFYQERDNRELLNKIKCFLWDRVWF